MTRTMQIKERSEAIGRAQRALKALGEHPVADAAIAATRRFR